MTTPEGTDHDAGRDMTGRLALAAAIVLGIAAVFTAWGAYRANLTSDVVIRSYAEQQVLMAQATETYGLADQQSSMEEQFFLSYAINSAQDNAEATAYLEYAMSNELWAAVEWWIAQPVATGPGTPFVEENPAFAGLPSQQLARTADDLVAQAEAKRVLAETANADSDRFELSNVFFAIVLFIAGVTALVTRRRIQLGLLGLGVVMLVMGIAILVTTPGWTTLP